jgi:hypothetical protein
MMTDSRHDPRRYDHAQTLRRGPRAVVRTTAKKRDHRGIILACAWLAAAAVLVMMTTSCARIPCPGGYPDPNWCTYHYSGGGG